MANYDTLKSAIQQVVKTNGNNEITGALLQQSLLAMINSLGAGYQFIGIATPTTNPGTHDQRVFYIAEPGTYPNFGGAVIDGNKIGVFYYDAEWNVDTMTFPIADESVTTAKIADKAVTEEKLSTSLKEKIVHPVSVMDSGNNADLDIADENGNVLARFENGNFRVKNFDSAKNNANLGIDSIAEFSTTENYAIDDIVRRDGLLYRFVEAHDAGEWNESQVEQTNVMQASTHPVSVMDSGNNVDLDIADENGNVLARFSNGNFRVKKFDTKTINTKTGIIIFSPITQKAWASKQNNYEAWPFGNVWFDPMDGSFNVIYTSSTAHVSESRLVLYRKKINGEWQTPVVIADSQDGHGKRCHGSGLDKNGNYIALVIAQLSGGGSTDGNVVVYRSADNGTTWTNEGIIQIDGVTQIVGETGSCYRCKDGRLLSYFSKTEQISGHPYSHIVYSDDNGITWKKATPIDSLGGLEGSFFEMADSIFCVVRQNQYPILLHSNDNGTSWETMGNIEFHCFNAPIATLVDEYSNTAFLLGGDRGSVVNSGMGIRYASIKMDNINNGLIPFGTKIANAKSSNFANFSYCGIAKNIDNDVLLLYYDSDENGCAIYEMNGKLI